VGGIADAQQPGLVPLLEPVDRNGEELDVVPGSNLLHAFSKERGKLRELRPEGRKALLPEPLE